MSRLGGDGVSWGVPGDWDEMLAPCFYKRLINYYYFINPMKSPWAAFCFLRSLPWLEFVLMLKYTWRPVRLLRTSRPVCYARYYYSSQLTVTLIVELYGEDAKSLRTRDMMMSEVIITMSPTAPWPKPRSSRNPAEVPRK
jgi:hypothetical protein